MYYLASLVCLKLLPQSAESFKGCDSGSSDFLYSVLLAQSSQQQP